MSQPEEFKQWVTTQSGLDSLSMTTAPIPEPGENEVLVKIHTVSLNYRDTEVCMGLYGHHASISQSSSSPPLVPCSDMCGTIIALGSTSNSPSSTTWTIGARVLSIFNQSHLTGQITSADMSSGLGLPLPGVLAEYRVFPSSGLVACPAYLTDEEACTLPIAAVTAWMSINWQQPIGSPFQHAVQGSEKPVVLLQGTGGVSISGLQIATALGFSTIVTSSSDVKLARAKEMGATYTINYKSTPNWHEEVMSLTSKRGASIILETGGASTLRKSFACIAFGGCISCVGYLGGKEDEAGKQTNVNVLALMRNVTLHGILNGPRDRFEEMLGLYERREIRPVVDRVFEFGEAKEALEHLFAGRHFGKVVVKVA